MVAPDVSTLFIVIPGVFTLPEPGKEKKIGDGARSVRTARLDGVFSGEVERLSVCDGLVCPGRVGEFGLGVSRPDRGET